MIDTKATGTGVGHSQTHRLSKCLALSEIGDQETDEIYGDTGAEVVVLVHRGPIEQRPVVRRGTFPRADPESRKKKRY